MNRESLLNNKEFFSLCVDTATGKVVKTDPEGAKFSSEAIREKILELLGVTSTKDKMFPIRFQTHQREIFAIVIETIAVTWPEFYDTPFMQRFVDYRSYAWGEIPVFEVEDQSLFVVSKIAAGTWDTRRQKAMGMTEFTLETEIYDIHVYGEFRDFLSGRLEWGALVDKVRRSIMWELQYRVFAAFMSLGDLVRPELTAPGNPTRRDIITLAETIRGLTGTNPIIAGTRLALDNILEGLQDYWMSNGMKDEINQRGLLPMYQGYEVMPIPTAIRPGTFELRPDSNRIFVLPGDLGGAANGRPIKIADIGVPLVRENRVPQANQDQTLDYQVQYEQGCAIVVNNWFGMAEFA